MNTIPVIRKADINDAGSIQHCVEAAYRHYLARIGKLPGPMLDDYGKVIRQHAVHVVDADGIVGVLVLIDSADGILLDNVAIHPDHQGRGLGRRLIDLAESEAVRRGYKKIDLYTHECMTENIEMYAALGYRETERREEHGYNRVYMQKQLSQQA